jgi:hypothetical protein
MTDKTTISLHQPVSPLTKFICALYKRSLAERMTSDPQKAADGYGLPLKLTSWWITQARQCEEQWPIRGGRK